jgi:hypothetical protein
MSTLARKKPNLFTPHVTNCEERKKRPFSWLFALPVTLRAFASCLLALLHDEAEEERHEQRRASKEGQSQDAPHGERSPHYPPCTGHALG